MARRPRLHEGLVGARTLVGSRYLADPELRRQYETELAPRTTVALARVFAQIGLHERGVRRVLDLGSGTGAAGVAARDHFGPAIEVISVDRVPGSGVLLADLVRPGRPPGVKGRFDLLLAAHLLNELPIDTATRATLVMSWCEELLEEAGTCVLIEPALRSTSRELLAVRDRLVGAGLFVAAPCFFAGPCPALARERDWCHDAAPWERTAQGRSRVDFSYLVLRRQGEPARDPALFRVVSDRLREKGRLRVFGCGPAGRHPLVRLDRDRAEPNQAFDALERGQVVRVEKTSSAADGLRLTRLSRVLPG